MASKVAAGGGRWLALPGRRAEEIVAAPMAEGVTLRRVEIPPASPGGRSRRPHVHPDFEEVIHVLSGRGSTSTPAGEVALAPGDTLLIPRGEPHATRNLADEPLVLLCFFPTADLGRMVGDGLLPDGAGG